MSEAQTEGRHPAGDVDGCATAPNTFVKAATDWRGNIQTSSFCELSPLLWDQQRTDDDPNKYRHRGTIRQLASIRKAPNGQIHVETVPLILVILTVKLKSQAMLNLNSLNRINTKAELYRTELALRSATTIKTSAMSEPNGSNPV
jgi:hypothetical protein